MNPEQIRSLLSELCGEEQSGDLFFFGLADSQTPLEVLRGTKEQAKTLLRKATTDQQRNAASFLYHAAVAAAYARHGVNISSRALHGRWGLYEDLATALATHPLGGVFRAAVERGVALESASGNPS
jgi:hypothetical protein